jgi:hypothetical protein
MYYIEDTLKWKRKHQIALRGELALEEAMELPYDIQQDEWMNEWLER